MEKNKKGTKKIKKEEVITTTVEKESFGTKSKSLLFGAFVVPFVVVFGLLGIMALIIFIIDKIAG